MQERIGKTGRRTAGWALVALLPAWLGACSGSADKALGTERQAPATVPTEDTSGQPIPNLASVPAQPPLISPEELRRQVAQGLAADRANAEYLPALTPASGADAAISPPGYGPAIPVTPGAAEIDDTNEIPLPYTPSPQQEASALSRERLSQGPRQTEQPQQRQASGPVRGTVVIGGEASDPPTPVSVADQLPAGPPASAAPQASDFVPTLSEEEQLVENAREEAEQPSVVISGPGAPPPPQQQAAAPQEPTVVISGPGAAAPPPVQQQAAAQEPSVVISGPAPAPAMQPAPQGAAPSGGDLPAVQISGAQTPASPAPAPAAPAPAAPAPAPAAAAPAPAPAPTQTAQAPAPAPAAAKPQTSRPRLVGIVYFPGELPEVQPRDRAVLAEIARLQKARDGRLRIVGHGLDDAGGGAARAEAVAAVLIGLGVPDERIQTEGVADSQPMANEFATGGDPSAGNRRAEIFLEN